MNFIKFSAIKTLVIINSKFHKICFAEADNHLFMRFSNIIDYLSLRIRRNLVSNQNSQFGGALFNFLPNFWCADEIDQNILSQNNWPDSDLVFFEYKVTALIWLEVWILMRLMKLWVFDSKILNAWTWFNFDSSSGCGT